MSNEQPSQNLGVTYRPKTFAGVLGNRSTIQALREGAASGTLGNALLFSGPAGSGKTTLSMILGRAVNCEAPRKDGSPCNKCEACLDDGGVVYNDCAANGNKDAILNLVAQQRVQALYKRRVVILDECHALSYGGTGAATTLLTAMEDPNCKTLWLLCTNLPEKLSEAMRSRCTVYALQSPPPDEFSDYMMDVMEREWGELPASEEVTAHMLSELYTTTGGQVRAALNALPLLYTNAKYVREGEVLIEADEYIAKLLSVMLGPNPVDRFPEFVKATHGLKAHIGAPLETQFGNMRAAIDNLIAYSAGMGNVYHPVAKRLLKDMRNKPPAIDALLHATLALSETERHMKGVALSVSADRSILISAVMLYLDRVRS